MREVMDVFNFGTGCLILKQKKWLGNSTAALRIVTRGLRERSSQLIAIAESETLTFPYELT